MSHDFQHVGRVVGILLQFPHYRRATLYVSPRRTVKATRQHRHDARMKAETFIVTIGVPNYPERAFIKAAKRAREPFPVQRVQLATWPNKKGRHK